MWDIAICNDMTLTLTRYKLMSLCIMVEILAPNVALQIWKLSQIPIVSLYWSILIIDSIHILFNGALLRFDL